MDAYFRIIDYLVPILALFFVVSRGSLSIVYVPFLYFAHRIVGESNHIVLMQLMFFLFPIGYAVVNFSFLKRNAFSSLLVIYYSCLLLFSDNLKDLKWLIIYSLWLFLIIPLASEIFANVKREIVFKELCRSAFLIMSLFVLNTFLCTAFSYYPEDHYGFNSGISFGNISIDLYSVFPLAIFLLLRRGIRDNNILYLILYLVSMFLIMLTLRRTVMLLSVVASVMVLLELLNGKQLKGFFAYGIVICGVGLLVFYNTGFGDQLTERIEMRNLQERQLTREGRFLEFGLVYKDLFVIYEYDPWLGYGVFDSPGNYGKSIFGTRPLHSDITYIIHSSGFLGLSLYVSMLVVGFLKGWQNVKTREDRILFYFVLLYAFVFFVLGSSRNLMSPVLLYCMLGMLGATKNVNTFRWSTDTKKEANSKILSQVNPETV